MTAYGVVFDPRILVLARNFQIAGFSFIQSVDSSDAANGVYIAYVACKSSDDDVTVIIIRGLCTHTEPATLQTHTFALRTSPVTGLRSTFVCKDNSVLR